MVNNQGALNETRYDLSMRQVQTINYATPIDITSIPTWTTNQVVTIAAENQDGANDRVNYFILDPAGQQQFVFDPLGAVTEQRYDAMGRIITKIKYSTFILNPAQWALLSLSQIASQLVLDPLNDQFIYQLFDSRGKPQFVVDPECYVTAYIHDGNGNLTQQIQFANSIVIPSSYTSLFTLLLSLAPNNAQDRIVTRVYDTANRQIKLIDALNHGDFYALDVCGNIVNHTDRNNNTWTYIIDGANRVTDEITPAILLTSVQQATVNNNVQLSYQQQLSTVTKHTVYDEVGNKLKIVAGYGSNEARTMSFGYTVCNQISGSAINSVSLDDPTLPGSFANPPTLTTTITTTIVYNAKQQKVACQNENGLWHFKIYDAMSRKIYNIDELGAVIAYVYNSFGEVVQKIYYATPLTIDLSVYTTTGIPVAVVQQNIITSSNDKITLMLRDQRGDILQTTSGVTSTGGANVFYFNAKLLPAVFGYANPQTQQFFDAFRRCICTQKLISTAQNQMQWVASYSWYNRVNKVVAECDVIGRAKLYSYDAFRNTIQRTEYATLVEPLPTLQTTLQQFTASLTSTSNDKIYQMTFDVIGQQLTETLLNVVVQEIALNSANNIPSFNNLVAQNLTVSCQYSNTQQKIAITYEDQANKYFYFNARGDLIAVTDVPRVCENINKQTTTLTPLTYFGVNSFGQTVMTTRYKQGTLPASALTLPLPIALDPDDQCELSLMDNRGLISFKQDADLNVTGFTYIAAKHLTAREYSLLTHWLPAGLITHLDEKRFLYDVVGNTLQATIYRDNQTQQTTQSQYDVFHHAIAEGPGNNVWNVQRFYDTCDNCWKSNDNKGVWTIKYFDLLGYETNRIVSAVQDLSVVSYLNLPGLMEQSIQNIEQTVSQRDEAGRLLQRDYPAYLQPANDNVPLNVSVLRRRGKLYLSWISPHEENFAIDLKILAHPLLQTSYDLNIEYDAHSDCYFADLSAIKNLATGKYRFYLTYNSKLNTPYIHVKNWVKPLRSCGDIHIDTQLDSSLENSEVFKNTLDFSCSIKILDRYAELQLNITQPFSSLPIKMVCFYQGNDGNKYLHVDTLDLRRSKKECIDSKDQILNCNTEFKHPVAVLLKISLSLVLDTKNTLLPLLINHEIDSSAFNTNLNTQIHSILLARKSLLVIPIKHEQQDANCITYLNTSKGRMAAWSKQYTYSRFRFNSRENVFCKNENYFQAILIDISHLPPGIYPFKYGNITDEFKVGSHSIFRVGVKSDDTLLAPKRSYVYDAWDKKITEVDGLGNVTQSSYNLRGAIASLIQPPVVVVNADGTADIISPQWIYAYDQRGFKIGVLDPNGNTTVDLLDSAGQIVSKVLAEGTVLFTHMFDALGRIYNYYDSRQKLWIKTYNHHDYVLTSTSPLNNITAYTYDEQQHRNFVSLPGDMNYYYNYDPCNNMQMSYLPLLQCTQYQSDRNHQLLTQINPDQTQLTWQRNYFGNTTAHIDLSGANYVYIYDYKWQKTGETSLGGSHGKQLIPTGIEFKHKHSYINYGFGAVANVNTQYIYAAGHLQQVNDIAMNSASQYSYDLESRPIQLITSSPSISFTRYVTTTLDALGREVLLQDSFFNVTMGYDAVSNRRMLIPALGLPAWNIYDAANRVTLYSGVLIDNQIILYSDYGMAVGYTQNFRSSQMQVLLNNSYTSTLTYYDDGLLSTTTTHAGNNPPNIVTQAVRTYTPGGFLQTYTQSGPIIPPYPVVTNMGMIYDLNGWLLTSSCTQGDSVITTQYGSYNNLGLPISLQLNSSSPPQTDNLITFYTGFDEWQPALIGGTSGATAYTSTMLLYDVNGNNATKLIQGAGSAFMTTYMVAPGGLIVMSSQMTATENLISILQSGAVCIEGPQNPTDTWYFYSLAGQPVASYSMTGGSHTFSLVNYIQPVSDNYPPPTPPLFAVGPGMTLSSVAAANYGDPSFSTQVAYANDFASSDTLPVGYTLQLPQLIAAKNQANSSVPYGIFLTTILGSIYAGNSVRIAQKRRHVSELEEIAGAIIIGVVGLVSGGVGLSLASVIYEAEGLVVGSLVEAAIAGISNAVIQGVAIGLGMQESFSYRGMLGAAVLGAATGPLQVNNLLPNGSKDSLAVLLFKNGMMNAMEQLTEMAAGQQDQFDIRELLSAMVVVALGQKISAAALQKYQNLNSLWLKKIINPHVQQATLTVGESMLDAVITKQYSSVEKNLLQSLGTGMADYLGNIALNSAVIQNLQLSIQNYLTAANDSTNAVQAGLSRYGLFSRNNYGIFNQAANDSSSTPVNDAATNLVHKNSVNNSVSPGAVQVGVLGGDSPESAVNATGVNAANDSIWNLNPNSVESLFSQVSNLPPSQQAGFINQWLVGLTDWKNIFESIVTGINQEGDKLIPEYSNLVVNDYFKAAASNSIEMFNEALAYEQKLQALTFFQSLGKFIDIYNRVQLGSALVTDGYHDDWKALSENVGQFAVGFLGSRVLGVGAGILGLELSPLAAIGIGIGTTAVVQPALDIEGQAAGDDVYYAAKKIANSF